MSLGVWSLLLLLAAPASAEQQPGPVFELERARRRQSEPAAASIDFSHRLHTDQRLRTRCVDCHRLSLDGNRFRPTPADSCGGCHIQDELLARYAEQLAARPRHQPSGPVEPIHALHIYYDCLRCHPELSASERVGDFPLPPRDNSSEVCVQCHARAVRFNHSRHLKVETRTVDCDTCHRDQASGIWYGNPGHPECWQCHDITMLALSDGCNLCHLHDPRSPKSYNIERASVLHKEHPPAKVECTSCHQTILDATSLEQLEQQRLQASKLSCTRCHVVPEHEPTGEPAGAPER